MVFKKWNIPKSAYIESMNDALSTEKGFTQWYLAINGGKIIGGDIHCIGADGYMTGFDGETV